MAYANMLQNRALTRKHNHALIAAGCIDSDFTFGIAAEVAHYSAVCMVLQLGVARPELFPVVIPQCIADQNLILAVAVYIPRIRIVTCLPGSLPQQFEFVIEYPEISIPILDQNLV